MLRAALPAELPEITTAFETVGHIAHMNLRDDQLPYKRFIGEVCVCACVWGGGAGGGVESGCCLPSMERCQTLHSRRR